MGIRAYAVKTHTIEYDNRETFNRQLVNVLDLLDENGVEVHYKRTADIERANWEIHDVEGFTKLIERLEKLPPERKNRFLEDYTNGEVIEAFKIWSERVDKKDNIIRVHWF